MESGDKNQQIFKEITELVTEADFTKGQLDFFETNCQAFTDDEENKHEYKELHEEYIVLCETAIDAVIKSKF